ncbi:MAG: serine hydrolase [Chitinophagales bacterium]|nr:serine hydrolase [Chitinophagales bacterium]
MRSLLFSITLIACLASSAQTNKTVQALDSTLSLLYKTGRFNGTVLYAEKGKVLYKKAFGIVDSRTNQPLTTGSSFNLASVTKQFIGMGILILQEQGKLKLDDDVRYFIPELPYRHISIRHLLTHTSGIPEYFDIFQRYRSPLDTLTNDMMIQMFAKYRPSLDFGTGSKWEYSNTNYILLASIIERASKKSLKDFIADYITMPLGMKDTYVYTDLMPSVPQNHVYGFSEVDGKKKLNDLTNMDGVAGDGNLYSSAEDLFKWDQGLYTEKLVKRSTLQQAFAPVRLNNDSTYPYGFGWIIEKENEIYLHTGGWAGFGNIICRDVKNKRTLIILSSGDNPLGIQNGKFAFLGKEVSIPATSLITNVQLIDGTGTPARKASVRIEGKRIIAIGNLTPFEGETVINGNGKVLAPGFIDTHSHLFGSLSNQSDAIAALNQGVTTIVSGQDGESDPVDSVKALLHRVPVAVNVATYTGHSTLRKAVVGTNDLHRIATADEIKKMSSMLNEELDKGSLGLSTGLEYEAAFYSNRDEIIELAKIAAIKKARYISHLRSEDINLNDAIDEIINIGREAKLPVQVSHIKIALKDNWGTAPELLAQLQAARDEGIDITADCYTYDFWNSTIRVLFPKKDFTSLEGARFATEHLYDPSGSVLVRFLPEPEYEGKTVSAIAAMRKETPEQTLLALVAAAEEFEKKHPGEDAEGIMGKAMSDDDVSRFLSWQHTNICSDGAIGGHPRAYGTFTRFLGRYIRDKKIMSLETAVNKMTALAAEHTGIRMRGVVADGFYADLVLFDPETVMDNADINNPKTLSDGILKVWVNGVEVYSNKQMTGKYPGVFIKR